MPLDILQQYAVFKSRAKDRLKKALAARAQLESEISALQSILGEMGGDTPGRRLPRTNGIVKPTHRRGRRKRTRRSPEQLKKWAMDAVLAIKMAKHGAKKGDIEKAIGEKLPQVWVEMVEKTQWDKAATRGG